MSRAWKSRGRLAVIAAVASGALAACGSGSTNLGSSRLVSSLPPAKGAVSQINWNVTGEPDTLDPRNAVNYGSGQIVSNMCEALFKMDDQFNVSPNLASSFKQLSPTKLQLTIRSGVRFWDGKPLTAADVAYSLQRSAAPASVVSFAFIFVKSIEATGPMQVTVTFRQPDATFLDNLATISGAVIEKGWGERTGSAIGTSSGGLMCTGPYKFVSWTPGTSITMVRNLDYWNKSLKPFAARVVFTFISNDTTLAQALNSGEIDGSYELPPSTIPLLTKSSVGRVVFGPSTESATISVAHPGGPLADPKLLDALNRALDRNAIARVVFDGAATPNYTELTPTTWPNAEKSIYQAAYDHWVTARSYDLAAAKALVKQSSYAGQTLVLAIDAGDQTASLIAQLFQQEASQIGVKVKIQELQPLVFAQAGYDPTKRQGIDLIYASSFNSQQNPLEPLGFDHLPGQAYNYTNSDDARVVKLLNEARSTFDPKKRAEMVVAAQALYEPANPNLALVSNNEVTFINNRLSGAITSFAYWSMPQMAYIGAAN